MTNESMNSGATDGVENDFLSGRYHLPISVECIGKTSDDRLVFFDPSAPNWIALPQKFALLLTLFDGCRSIRETISMFWGKSALDLHLLEWLGRLISEGWLIKSGRDASCHRVMRSPPKLTTVSLYLTSACNLRCRNCFYNAGNGASDTLETTDLLVFISSLVESGVSRLYFLGGEPLIHPELFSLAKHAATCNLSVHLITNGTLIDTATACRIRNYFTDVQVSLDGLKDDHEYNRGGGTFQSTIRGIKNLIRAGANLSVSCTLSKRNIDSVDQFVNFLHELKVPKLHFTKLQPAGRGSESNNQYLSDADFYKTLRRIHGICRGRLASTQFLSLCNIRPFEGKLKCGVASGSLEVDHRGDIYPCYQLMTGKYKLGNIRDVKLSEVFKTSPILDELRSMTVENDPTCNRCSVRQLCGGGCLSQRIGGIDKFECEGRKKFWTSITKLASEGEIQQLYSHQSIIQRKEENYEYQSYDRLDSEITPPERCL